MDLPVDDLGFPERGEHESWKSYHRRWWFLWAGQSADKRGSIVTERSVRTHEANRISYNKMKKERQSNDQG